jgi:hypothetical protein
MKPLIIHDPRRAARETRFQSIGIDQALEHTPS